MTPAFVWLQAASCLNPAQQNGCSSWAEWVCGVKGIFQLGHLFIFSLHAKSNLSLIDCQFLNVCAFWFLSPVFLTYSNCPVLPQGTPGERVAGMEWVNSLRMWGDQMQTTRTLTTKTHETAASRMTVAATPISLSSFAVRYLMQRNKWSQCLACSAILAVQSVPLSHWRKALHRALNEENCYTTLHHTWAKHLDHALCEEIPVSCSRWRNPCITHTPGEGIPVSYPR